MKETVYEETAVYLDYAACQFIATHAFCGSGGADPRDERRVAVDMKGDGPLVLRVRCLGCKTELEADQTVEDYGGTGRPRRRRRHAKA